MALQVASEKGFIYKIQPLSIHFGPGIRTVVFLQGCPLHCLWCPFPQAQQKITLIEKKCTSCGICSDACPSHAIEAAEKGAVRINHAVCNGCGICLELCPAGALEQSGTCCRVEALLHEVEKGVPAYRQSDGGITVSGGEPALQAEFVAAFLQQCRRRNIHSAVTTSAFGPWHKVAMIAERPDLLYITIPCINDRAHREATGVSNQSILRNIRKIAIERTVILRVPVLPNTKRLVENIKEIACFTRGLGKNALGIELFLRSDPVTEAGGNEEQRNDDCPKAPHCGDDELSTLKSLIESYGIECSY